MRNEKIVDILYDANEEQLVYGENKNILYLLKEPSSSV